MRNTTTPSKVSRDITHLCNLVSPGEKPKYVKVVPDKDSLISDCFPNVERVIKKKGGSIVYGWIVWEWPKVSVEFEFHGVWLTPENKLIDVTPYQDGEKRILFLPDRSRKYEGSYISTKIFPLNEDPEIKEYVKVSQQLLLIKYGHSVISSNSQHKNELEIKKQMLYNSICNRGFAKIRKSRHV